MLAGLLASCIYITVVTNSGNVAYGYPSEPDYIVERQGYAIGYDISHKQARWVSYSLDRHKATARVTKRKDYFEPDSKLGEDSATLADYKRSGYDRGHLCPAADQNWSTNTMIESFLMSNMSPQVGEFNRGVWRELELWVREQAIVETNIFIYTGPIFSTNHMVKTIGPSKVTVPVSYYKVILDETEPKKMIGFVLSNQGTSEPYSNFVCTVREVERLTGLNFFSNMSTNEQERLETSIVPSNWGL